MRLGIGVLCLLAIALAVFKASALGYQGDCSLYKDKSIVFVPARCTTLFKEKP